MASGLLGGVCKYDGNDGGVVQDAGHTPANNLTEICSLTL